MQGWTDTGRPVRLDEDQAHVVRVLLGRAEPDEAFDAFWRKGRGGGKTTAVATAGRYTDAEGGYNDVMSGLNSNPRMSDESAARLPVKELRERQRSDPQSLPIRYRHGEPTARGVYAESLPG
jgi:hypothetical protein